MNAATKEFLEALERLGCKPRRTLVDFFRRKLVEWIAPCPAHPNGPPTLHISNNSDGGYTLYCEGRCNRHCQLEEIPRHLHRVLPRQFPKPYFNEPPPSLIPQGNGEMNNALKDFLALLNYYGYRPEWSGRDWIAPCPAHPNGPPTLHISNTPQGYILLDCRGDCNPDLLMSQLQAIVPKFLLEEFCRFPKDFPTEGSRQPNPIPAWQPYPTELLPEPFRRFVEAAADALGCDASYVALPLVIAAAAAIGSTRVLAVKKGWEAPSILWGVIIGESGSKKSPALRLATQWTEKKQRECLAAYETARRRYDAELQVYEKALAEWKRNRNDDGELPPIPPEPPTPQRVLISDVTVEALAPILRNNPRGVLLVRDELAGWLASFDRYVQTSGGDVACWLSMYHGQPFVVDRKVGGAIYVPRAVVSLVGGMQPGVLRRALGRVHRDNGLLSRLLLVMPPTKVKRWTDTHVPESILAEVGSIFDCVFSLDHDVDHDGRVVPRVVTLSPRAQTVYIDFYDKHAKELADASGVWANALAKLEEIPARLALVLHLVRWAGGEPVNPDVVDEDSIEAAVRLTDWHKQELRRIYALLDLDDEIESLKLLEWIARRGGVVSVRDVTHGVWAFRGQTEAAEAALGELVQKGFGEWVDEPVNQKGGRPKRVFRLSHQHHHHQNLLALGDFRGFGDVVMR